MQETCIEGMHIQNKSQHKGTISAKRCSQGGNTSKVSVKKGKNCMEKDIYREGKIYLVEEKDVPKMLREGKR